MRQSAMLLALLAFVSFSGCGGPSARMDSASAAATTPAPAPTTTPVPVAPNVAGNWQFSTTSAVPGKDALTFAGDINQVFASNASQPDSTVSGAFHIDGSSCFDRLVPLGVTGTVSASGSASMTFAATNGQVVTLTGTFPDKDNFKGTYRIDGGCAGGDQGNVTATDIPSLPYEITGTFTDSTQKTFNMDSDVYQDVSASAQGSFAIHGTTTFDTPCFSKGTLNPGVFPSGSFLLGRLISLEVNTGNGILTFVGTMDPMTWQISGSYSVSGGSCDGNGTAALQAKSPWDY